MCCKNSDCRGINDCKQGQAPFPYGPRRKAVCCQCPAGKVLNKEKNGCTSTGVPIPTARPSHSAVYEPTPPPSAVPEPTPYGPTPAPISVPTAVPTYQPTPTPPPFYVPDSTPYEPTPAPTYTPTALPTYQPTPTPPPFYVPDSTPSEPTPAPTYTPTAPPTSEPTSAPTEAVTGGGTTVTVEPKCNAGFELRDGDDIQKSVFGTYKPLRAGFKMCCKDLPVGAFECPDDLHKLSEERQGSRLFPKVRVTICCYCEKSTPTWYATLDLPFCI